MDTWHATKELMLNRWARSIICPLKSNRLVDNSGGTLAYLHVDSLEWSGHDATHWKIIKIRDFPKEHKIKLFHGAISIHRTDMVVMNGLFQNLTLGAQQAYTLRKKIEQFHREAKQLQVSNAANAARRGYNPNMNCLMHF